MFFYSFTFPSSSSLETVSDYFVCPAGFFFFKNYGIKEVYCLRMMSQLAKFFNSVILEKNKTLSPPCGLLLSSSRITELKKLIA